MASSATVRIAGQTVELTNLDKVLYPETGFTKAQVIDYYRRMAPPILPHLEGRPITLKRYPEGVAGEFFYEKTCPAHRPAWVTTSAGQGGIDIDFCIIDSLPSLVWVANLASLEIHALLAKVDDLSRPTAVAFDLDPGPPATLPDCCEIALILRDMLQGPGLKSFPKTSGGKGLHFFLPLHTEVTYDQTKPFAKTVAQLMEKHYPDRVVSKTASAASTHAAPPPSGVNEPQPRAAGLHGTRGLQTYRHKRDFAATPEPAGTKITPSPGPVFVIQKHAAKRLHYDLRLEVEGVLKSWSVPRGPSSNPADRRLAVQVEDHPLDYQDFEGTIPKGQYGAGQVIVWDRGTYRNITDDPNHPTPMSKALEDGKVEVFFQGQKIKGGYALIQMQSPRTDKSNWLLIKLKDNYVGSLPEDLEEEGQSVTTGRTVQDLRRQPRPC